MSVGTGPVLARALQILDAFSTERLEMSLSELARHTGLPVSTVHRLAGPLVEWGALERDERGHYRIGLRLWEIGSLATRGLALREQALPFLADLAQVTREMVQLAVREGTELVFVERIAGTEAVPMVIRVGGRCPLAASGVGLVLLAHAPAPLQEEVLASPIERFTDFTITDPRVLRRTLADVRTSGFAISDRQLTPDSLSVGAPIHNARGAVVAAVSLVVRHGSVSPRALAPIVRTSARAISRALVSAD
ncbi:IclR family transcriptional regulator [Amycolatopsis rhabdoformis]|uniref:IclR family transcriptional regulator n=1 Tax=Amycolatopsis rhabdoformis TaxID=1448059 RepID=A0ABZ1IA14_9PSEU|nr:IclR family transcriptional regulator [Amycolatopsis rhabdoformis]WSE31306.1 IclR family transcriptional regulator [Amycolatopsis rhabdoformis]